MDIVLQNLFYTRAYVQTYFYTFTSPDNLKLIGFYCESCQQRLLLREWIANTGTDTKRHLRTECPFKGSNNVYQSRKITRPL